MTFSNLLNSLEELTLNEILKNVWLVTVFDNAGAFLLENKGHQGKAVEGTI